MKTAYRIFLQCIKTKCTVDVADPMARQYSGTRRWPVAIFCKILDQAGINPYILYRGKIMKKISKRVLSSNGSVNCNKITRKVRSLISETPLFACSKQWCFTLNFGCKRNHYQIVADLLQNHVKLVASWSVGYVGYS